jgi:hypothetical protein
VAEIRTEFERQLLDLFRKLSDDGQHAALGHINWMLSQEKTDPTPSVADPYPRAKKAPTR